MIISLSPLSISQNLRGGSKQMAFAIASDLNSVSAIITLLGEFVDRSPGWQKSSLAEINYDTNQKKQA
jgi:hypothetical protein